MKPVVKQWYQTTTAIILITIGSIAVVVLLIAAVSLTYYYCWVLTSKRLAIGEVVGWNVTLLYCCLVSLVFILVSDYLQELARRMPRNVAFFF